MRPDTVAAAVAAHYGVSKAQLLDSSAEDLPLRMALGEAQVCVAGGCCWATVVCRVELCCAKWLVWLSIGASCMACTVHVAGVLRKCRLCCSPFILSNPYCIPVSHVLPVCRS